MSASGADPGSLSLSFVESLFAEYARDPNSVPPDWRAYFDGMETSNGDEPARRQAEPARLGPSFKPPALFRASTNGHVNGQAAATEVAALQDRMDQLIRSYRVRGHMIARLDPLRRPRPNFQELDPEFYGFTEADMDRTFSTRTISGPQILTLRQVMERLRNTYCRWIGVQFMHIDDPTVKMWLQDRMESTENRLEIGRDEQIRILTKLTDAYIFEDFIQKKYIGAKSFSLEGGESLIPLLDLAIEKAGSQGIDEIVMAMAHRGRLNALANIMGKHPRDIFLEFEDADPESHLGTDDVKYHLGYSNDRLTRSGKQVHLTLCFNPSHLEFVNPVALGRVRARQDRLGDQDRNRAMAILVHGDAAFAGEGITQETLNLSELAPYTTGGALRVIVNNQIGFTTPPSEGRSTTYASDVARMLQIPIFHVNGEDPEAVAQVVNLAMDFRNKFKRDVVIDMYCYRRRGHNESDEPSFTQPLLYKEIAKRVSIRDDYLKRLLKLGGVTREEADRIAVRRREALERELSAARSDKHSTPTDTLGGLWKGYTGGRLSNTKEVRTAVEAARLAELIKSQSHVPDGFQPHPKLKRLLDGRAQMAEGKAPLDWSAAESLAFASLATDGYRVRLSGQDSARGTFSHRHAVLHDYETGEIYTPLQHLAADQAPVEIYNSPLSEAGVLGFEYGYSLDCPAGLILWEAQFGDFSNAAQVIIDQFISSGEDKWKRLAGLVLLLPHGYEGQGPEHSSARIERYLVLAAEDNIQVVNPTTPAQFFHLLRRQVLRRIRKPLIVMTPKSLLRHPKVVSTLDDLSKGGFEQIIGDPLVKPKKVKRVLMCSGKIYYDLLERREKLRREDVAILRMEQLYPLWDETLQDALRPYAKGTEVFWVQEEPSNMGAWRFLHARFCGGLYGKWPFHGVYRPASASPATGSHSSHALEQERILKQAYADRKKGGSPDAC